jgi:hypothetical protein
MLPLMKRTRQVRSEGKNRQSDYAQIRQGGGVRFAETSSVLRRHKRVRWKTDHRHRAPSHYSQKHGFSTRQIGS